MPRRGIIPGIHLHIALSEDIYNCALFAHLRYLNAFLMLYTGMHAIISRTTTFEACKVLLRIFVEEMVHLPAPACYGLKSTKLETQHFQMPMY